MSYMGQPFKRFEDPKLIAGRGSFVDDIQLSGMLYAAMLRRSHAHAQIKWIDVAGARELPGVVTVLTGEDTAGVLQDVPTRAMTGDWSMDEMKPVEQPVLARGAVMGALSSVGVRHIDTPLTGEKIWRALHGRVGL